MAVKIRLKRMGKIRAPFYRVVVMDSRARRDGRAIEEIGKYHPTEEPSVIDIKSDRAQYWLSVGAQPTEQVQALLKITGDWQKFKGESGSEGSLKQADAKPSKRDLYEAAMAAAGKADEDWEKNGATTARKKRAADQAKADEAKAEEPKAEEPKADDAAPAAADEAPASADAAVSEAEAAPAEGEAVVEAAPAGAEPPAEPAADAEA